MALPMFQRVLSNLQGQQTTINPTTHGLRLHLTKIGSPQQHIPLPASHPASSSGASPHLLTAQDRQHKISLLVKVWLFIAGVYLRAGDLDDASAAIDEANKLVESFEIEVGAEKSSARRFFEKGWAGGKSVDMPMG